MKQIFLSKILRKLLILSCLVFGLFFVTSENPSYAVAAASDCTQSEYDDCRASGGHINLFTCECLPCGQTSDVDCREQGGTFDTSSCTCQLGPGTAGCRPEDENFCNLGGGQWDGSICWCRYMY